MAKKVPPIPAGVETDAELDAEIAKMEADEADEASKAEIDKANADALPPVPAPPEPKPENSILLEDGLRVNVLPDQERAFRVQAVGGMSYDHCSDAPDGEWVYRKT